MSRGYHIRISLYPESSPVAPVSFIPASLFQPLPSHSSKSSLRRNTLTRPRTNSDYRLGPITVDWIDFDRMIPHPGRAKEHRSGPAEATFVPLTRRKTGTTNFPEGTVHVFRGGSSKPNQEQLEARMEQMTMDELAADADGILLGVLAVPSWMNPSDFLAFVAPAIEGIAHLRIIRDFAPNRSIVVLKFSNPADAFEFAEAYNGKPFNSMEPEICHVVHVLSVVIDVEDSVSQTIARLGSTQSSMYELPTCPVCLERMDSAVTGLITVPCSHTFHCMCLSKWGDSRCPVCRYSQNLLSSHPTTSTNSRTIPFSDPTSPSQTSCTSCASTTNLWICLICGNIGCGRYGQGHAQAHYQATTHLYALELETQRVWDYASDGYVHRLIQNKADGKLVELPSAAASSMVGAAGRDGSLGPSQADALSAEKIEAIGIEYSYLLTSQLDSQRAYYEEQTSELRAQLESIKSLLEEEQKRRSEEEVQMRIEEAENIARLVKEKAKAEQRANKALEVARKFEKELREEQAVSNGLMKNLAKMQEQHDNLEKVRQEFSKKTQDLEEQLRDVMFTLETAAKIQAGGGVESEAAGGSIVLAERPESTPHKSKTKKRK